MVCSVPLAAIAGAMVAATEQHQAPGTPQTPPGTWVCPDCMRSNAEDIVSCCGRPRFVEPAGLLEQDP